MMFGRGMREGSWNSEEAERLAATVRGMIKDEFARNRDTDDEDEDDDLEATCWED